MAKQKINNAQVSAVPTITTGSQSCLTGTATTAIALSSPAVYLCTVWVAANEANNPYFETALISTDGTTRSKVSILQDGASIAIGMSNLNMTITQSSGITLVVSWSITRLV